MSGAFSATRAFKMNLIRQFAAYYAPYKQLFVLDLSCAVLSGVLELAFPMAGSCSSTPAPRANWTLIILAAVALIVIYVINACLMVVVTYWGHMLGINIETDMRRLIFTHLQKLSFSFYDNHKTGHLSRACTKDLYDIGEVAHHGPEDVFIAVMTLIGTFVVMLTVNAQLAMRHRPQRADLAALTNATATG